MNIKQLRIEDIIVKQSFNCRKITTRENLTDLVKSLDFHKQMFPVLVAKREGKYHLVAGFRRVKALKKLRHPTVWAVVTELDLHTARVQNLLENLNRHQLSAFEEAEAYYSIYGEDQIERAVLETSKPRRWVQRRIKLAKSSDDIQKAAHSGRLTEGQLTHLLRLTTKAAQRRNLRRLLSTSFEEKEVAPSQMKSDTEVQNMMVKFCELGVSGLALKTLRWFRGNTSDGDLLSTFKEGD